MVLTGVLIYVKPKGACSPMPHAVAMGTADTSISKCHRFDWQPPCLQLHRSAIGLASSCGGGWCDTTHLASGLARLV